MKKTYYYITLVGILLISVIGVSYAWFSAQFGGTGSEMLVETGTLELLFTDGPEIEGKHVKPSWTASKTFKVTNTGTLPTNYTIWWKEFENTIEKDELVYSLTCTSYSDYDTKTEGGNCYGFEDKIMNTADDLRILSNIAIPSGYTHEYEITLLFKETGSEQNYNQGKRFNGTINIKEYYENETDLPVIESYNVENYVLTAKVTDSYALTSYAVTYPTADLVPDDIEWVDIKSTTTLNIEVELSDYKAIFWLKNRAGNIAYIDLTPRPTLTVDSNGGTWESNISEQIYNMTYDETKVLSDPIREGFIFDGWTLESQGTESSIIDGTFTMGEKDTTLTARWISENYTLTINPNGGSYNNTTSNTVSDVKYNSKINIDTPVRTGYTFTGWTVSSDKADLSTNVLTIGSEDCTLTANWTINDYPWIAYHNKMNTDGSGYTLVEADTERGSASYGSKVTPTVNTYIGFNSPNAREITISEIEANNIVNYNYERQKYNLIINPNGGSYNESTSNTTVSVYYEQQVNVLNPVRTGYNFINWSKSGDGTLTDSVFTGGLGETTLTANWEAIESLITFNSNGGNTPSFRNRIVSYGEEYGELPEVSRDGYIFVGWFTSASGGTQINSTDIVNITSSITLYAQWVNKIKLTINVNGGMTTQALEELYYPGTVVDLREPIRTDYIFAGWSFDGKEHSHTQSTITAGNFNTVVTANWLSTSLASTNFSCTKSEQTFTAPYDGYYQVELWGAQGGSATYSSTTNVGGKGGYTKGVIYLEANEELYVYVGQQGANITGNSSTVTTDGKVGYNGGGAGNGTVNNSVHGGGGGATDVRLIKGAWNNTEGLNSRIMVAGGGGGGSTHKFTPSYSGTGGFGGGLISGKGNPTNETCYSNGLGAIQTAVGGHSTCTTDGHDYSATSTSAGAANFGIGANYATFIFGNGTYYTDSGGGGGYYGGAAGSHAPGGGGSSFISGYAGVNAIKSKTDRASTNNTRHYSGKYFIDAEMQNGINSGDGKAKITYLGVNDYKRINTHLNNVRYIKDCMNGSTSNQGNYWIEVQAIKNGENIALNKTVTGTVQQKNDTTQAYSNIVDGLMDNSTGSSGYGYASSIGYQCITVDLSQKYDLDEVAVWRYFNDNRRFYESGTYVSSDNTNWIEITKDLLAETSLGKRVNAYSVDTKLYAYTGSEQLFVSPSKGKYKIELWGASGGGANGGKGGYTSGIITLNENDKFYIHVGGVGPSNDAVTNVGGYNGGGYSGNNSGCKSYGGGGSTDVRLTTGTWNNATGLKSRIMVAAGGAGTTTGSTTIAGAGGGLIGGAATTSNSTYNNSTYLAGGATQTAAGFAYGTTARAGLFGYALQSNSSGWGGGGGGGYWGGNTGCGTTGSGGSSYISGHTGAVAITSSSSTAARKGTNNATCSTGTSDNLCSVHYSGKKFTSTYMIDGTGYTWTNEKSTSVGTNLIPNPNGGNYASGVGHTGDGYARISYIGEDEYSTMIDELTGVRYIKDCINGNSVNKDNHWVEIQVIKDNVNIALNKNVTADFTPATSYGTGTLTSIVDGNIDSAYYVGVSNRKTSCVTIDLGDEYKIDEIRVWHYYNYNRTYYENITYISNNVTNWIKIMNTTEPETSNGKRFVVQN